jgi:tetratricopeptide (TPR) repeat protein
MAIVFPLYYVMVSRWGDHRYNAARAAKQADDAAASGKLDWAIKLAKLSVAADPHRSVGYVALARAYRQLGRHDLARRAFESGLGVDPNDGNSLLGLADLELGERNFQAARNLYMLAGRQDLTLEGNSTYLVSLALALEEVDSTEARKLTERACKLDPNNERAMSVWARLLLKKGSYEEARDIAHRLVERTPTNPYHQANFANALAGLQQWEQAAEHIEQATRLDPNNAEFQALREHVQAMRS